MSFSYLDWAATAPLCFAAAEAMKSYQAPGIGNITAGGANANSLYSVGRTAFKDMEAARKCVAKSLGVRPDEIIFTSGATEADNAALFGIVDALMMKADHEGNHDSVPNIVVSAIEHDAVLEAARVLGTWGARIVVVKPNKNGHITPEALAEVVDNDTLLVSIMTVNNEIGSVMDIPALAKVAHEAGALFHTDAVQALGKVPVLPREWGVDALSLSSHKVGGPKGVGALYLKARTPFSPQMVGGGQELGKRSGTQNVCGIVGFAAALEAAVCARETECVRLTALRDYCCEKLFALPGVKPSVCFDAGGDFAPHIINVTVDGFESETLILQLDRREVYVSGGSACSSHSLNPSHVLSALGMSRDRALTSLRISMGSETQTDDIDALIEALADLLENE